MIGARIVDEIDLGGNSVQNLGTIGGRSSTSNTFGVDVRGSTGFNASDTTFDFDYYQGNHNWFRPAFGNIPSQEPISASLGFNVKTDPDGIIGFVFTVFDAFGNVQKSGFDMVVGANIQTLLGSEVTAQIEQTDSDFIISADNDPRDLNATTWTYPQVSGFSANTFVVGVAGFHIDANGNSLPLQYTMGWDVV